MGRKPIGETRMTGAQKQALYRQREAEEKAKRQLAMERAMEAKTLQEARAILAAALES